MFSQWVAGSLQIAREFQTHAQTACHGCKLIAGKSGGLVRGLAAGLSATLLAPHATRRRAAGFDSSRGCTDKSSSHVTPQAAGRLPKKAIRLK